MGFTDLFKKIFGTKAERDLKQLRPMLDKVLAAYETIDKLDNDQLRAKCDELKEKMRASHIFRLQRNECTIEGGFILADLLNNYERVSDHCSNIAVAIIEVEHNSFDTHKYLNGVKYGNSVFNEVYENYERKYAL